MSEPNAIAEIPQNMTIYINNLNEKIKLDEVVACCFLSVREDTGSASVQDSEAQGSSLGGV